MSTPTPNNRLGQSLAKSAEAARKSLEKQKRYRAGQKIRTQLGQSQGIYRGSADGGDTQPESDT